MTQRRSYALSIGLGIATLLLLSALEKLPYGGTPIYVLSLPGLLMAGMFYPEGPHSGGGSVAAIVLVFVVNALVYAGLWFAALSLMGRRR